MITDTINTMDTVTIPGNEEGGGTRQDSDQIYIQHRLTRGLKTPFGYPCWARGDKLPKDVVYLDSYRHVRPSLWAWLR